MENNRNTQKHFFSLKMITKVMRIKINATPNDECWLTFRSTSWAFSRCFSTNRSVWIRVWITFWASSGEKELVFLSSCLHKSSTCLLKLLDYEEKQTLCSHVYSWKDSINRWSLKDVKQLFLSTFTIWRPRSRRSFWLLSISSNVHGSSWLFSLTAWPAVNCFLNSFSSLNDKNWCLH